MKKKTKGDQTMGNIIPVLENKKHLDYIMNHKDQVNIQEGFIYCEHVPGEPEKYIGIDNTTGNAIKKECGSIDECVKWLTEQENPEYTLLIVSKINKYGAYTKVK